MCFSFDKRQMLTSKFYMGKDMNEKLKQNNTLTNILKQKKIVIFLCSVKIL